MQVSNKLWHKPYIYIYMLFDFKILLYCIVVQNNKICLVIPTEFNYSRVVNTE